MGKATRWIKGLFGMKKDKESVENDSNYSGEKKEKRRWSFAKPGKENSLNENIPVASDKPWMRSYKFSESTEEERNKHAIAVAAATAAAADAAVAAAQAAAVVVRLTSQGGKGGLFIGGREKLFAAVKIQTVFRGYLARKALRALKGLVKLQALVRGYLVRKRAAATLHSMQALFRAQTAARSQRAHRSVHEIRAQKSTERFDSELHSRRLSACYEPSYNSFEESPKIVEIDACACSPKPMSRRMSASAHEYYIDDHHQYYHVMSSPLPCLANPSRVKLVPEYHNGQDFDMGYIEEDYYKFATAQSTPRFSLSGRGNHIPVTPVKSMCGDTFFRPSYDNNHFPNYMTNTQSFKAKLRSLSAPKQRPEPLGSKRRYSLKEIMAARSSFSGVRMQKRSSRSQAHEGFEL